MSGNFDISKMIEEISGDSKGDSSQDAGNEIQKQNKKDIDPSDIDSVAEGLIDMVRGDRSKADEIFDLFYDPIGRRTDNSEASKEALTKALELKIESSKNLIELLKIKSRFNESGSKVGIFLNSMNEKKAGIDLSNIEKELDDED